MKLIKKKVCLIKSFILLLSYRKIFKLKNMELQQEIELGSTSYRRHLTKAERLQMLLDANTFNESINWTTIINGEEYNVRYVLMTPDLARILYDEYNDTNRPLSKTNVHRLAKEMINNKWKRNGEGITFNRSGNMTNGQHRLVAVIKADKSFLFEVHTGLEDESFATIDGGRKRNPSDVLAHAGVVSAKNTSSLCKFIFGFKLGRYGDYNSVSERTLNNTTILEYYNTLAEEDVHSSVNFGQMYSKKANGILTPTIVGGMYYLFNEVDKEKSYEFLTKLCTGDSLSNQSPILALRNKLIKAKIDKTYHITPDLLIKNIVYCWEKFIRGENVKVIKLPEDYSVNL